MIRYFLIISLFWPTFLCAQTLDFPSNANLQAELSSNPDSYAMPIDPWDGGIIPTLQGEGALTTQAWRINATGLTTLQILRPLRGQLIDAGFDLLFECEAQACGGFDFRFNTPVLSPPDMQINLGDFRYLAATKPTEDGDILISLFVSRTAQAGYVQVTRVGPEAAVTELATSNSAAIRTATAPNTAQSPTDIPSALDLIGRAVLADLTFETGSAQLSDGPFHSLQTIADYLSDYPDRTIALVGHTDATGSLDGNIALSKRRAGSVLERLVSNYNVPRRQLDAQGMGYLSPIANNLTQDGRDANRRVEVIITSTDTN